MAYILLADAKTRLATLCLSSELTAWTAASDGDRQILLDRAVVKLESLAFVGQRYETVEGGQEELFPRVDQLGAYDYDEDADAYVIPQAIKDAICLEAVAILAATASSDYDEVDDLQEHGVKSVRISGTGLQYEFRGSSTSDSREGFYSKRAWRLLERYLARDVCVI